jgi:hypothetical protein
MKFKLFAVAALATAVGLAGFAQANTVIDTTGTFLGNIQPFGSPDTATYGQTFTTGATDTHLNSFQLYLTDDQTTGSGSLDVKGYIGTWDGLKATSILYTSPVLTLPTANGGALIPLVFSPDLQLLPNAQYVAFLSTSDLGFQVGFFSMPLATTGAIGGMVYFNNGTDFAALTNSSWDCSSSCGLPDAWFKAELSSATPLPAALPLFATGLGALGLFGWRRKKKAAALPA